MILDKSVFLFLFIFYLINANESEISETTLAQINNKLIANDKRIEDLTKQSETTLTQLKNEFNNKFIAYEKRIEDLTKQLTGLKNINT